jgi:hypothetical protein
MNHIQEQAMSGIFISIIIAALLWYFLGPVISIISFVCLLSVCGYLIKA